MKHIPISILFSTSHIQNEQVNTKDEVRQMTASCFAMNIDNKQYIITARHFFDYIDPSSNEHWTMVGDSINIKYNNKWNNTPIKIVGHGDDKIDISVFVTEKYVSLLGGYNNSPEIKTELWYGDEVYFLGFPHMQEAEAGFTKPFPILKSAKISSGNRDYLYLDGHNNSGFSGGPVLFQKDTFGFIRDEKSMRIHNPYPLKIVGVVSGYIQEEIDGDIIQTGIGVKSKMNSGIMLVYRIEHAIRIIENNPIGLTINLTEEEKKIFNPEKPQRFANLGEKSDLPNN